MLLESPVPESEAPRDCPLCPRLVGLREELRLAHPDWWNAPVPAFGDRGAWLGIVGLAPGMFGANRTGRPFTGDFAGLLLYETLLKFGLAEGAYAERIDDGLRLTGCLTPLAGTAGSRRRPLLDRRATLRGRRLRSSRGARLGAMMPMLGPR